MRVRTCALLVALMIVTVPQALRAQEPDTRPGIAVLPFDVTQLPPTDLGASGLNFGLQQMLLTELQANPALRIVDRRALNEVLREMDLQESGRVDAQTAARIGNIVGARFMVGTSYFDNSGDVRLDGRIIDVETTEIIQTARVRGQRDDLFDLVGGLAEEVTNDVDLPPLPAANREARRSQRVPMEAIALFCIAVEREEAGNEEEALETLQAVVDRWPGYTDAADLRTQILSRSGLPAA